MNKLERIIFHIDVNNAFLSWTAIDLLNHGYNYDIRNSYAVIGGDPKARKGIVLAKSNACKKLGIYTSMTLYEAKKKCSVLKIQQMFESVKTFFEHFFDFQTVPPWGRRRVFYLVRRKWTKKVSCRSKKAVTWCQRSKTAADFFGKPLLFSQIGDIIPRLKPKAPPSHGAGPSCGPRVPERF